MPLCRPAPLLGASLFWRDIRRSNFLILLKLKKPVGINWLSDKYKILLSHNQFVIAQAKTRREIEELWILCSNYTELLAGNSRLVSFFTSLWKESTADAIMTNDLKMKNKLLVEEEKIDSINTVSLSNGKKRFRSLSLPQIAFRQDRSHYSQLEKKQMINNHKKLLLSLSLQTEMSPFIIFESYPDSIHVFNEDSPQEIEITISEEPIEEENLHNSIEINQLHFPENLYAKKLLELINVNSIIHSTLGVPKLLRAIHSFDRNNVEQSIRDKNNFIDSQYICDERKQEEEEVDNIIVQNVAKELLLSFEKGDLFLGYFDCVTGNSHLALAQNQRGEFGLFYKDDFTTEIHYEIDQYIESKLFNKQQQKKEINGILLRSWIWKKGYWGPWKDWKQRWFVLDSHHLRIYYYATPEDEKMHNSRGMINIRDITTIHESFYPGSRRKKGYWPFELHTADREWLLHARTEEDMKNWIEKINLLALHNDHRLTKTEMKFDPLTLEGETNTPGLNSSNANNGVSEAANGPNPVPSIADDNFDTFGAPDGEEIVNKKTILNDIDRWLGYHGPPALEYIYVEPYLNYVNGSIQLTANPYGHAVVRYTLPDTGEQVVMNIVGLANQEMVNFLPPEDFFFSTNFDIKTGNEQGGIYNRTFASVRVQRLPPEKILAMHQFFLDLHDRSHKSKAMYNIAIGPILNRLGKASYGNCAYWTSEGLRHAGILTFKGVGSIIPKAIWIDIFEKFKAQWQHSELSNNVTVVYYKRIPHAKRFYGLDANFSGWGRPSESDKYDDLEKYADAIVYVPPNSKKAIITSSPHSGLMMRRAMEKSLASKGIMSISLDVHIEPRILFNDYFYNCYLASDLSKIDPNTFFEDNQKQYQTFHLISCGYPIWSNSWLVDERGCLFKTTSSSKNKVEWVEIEPPLPHLSKLKERYSQLVAGQDSTCWIIFNDQIFIYRPNSPLHWKQIEGPSEFGIQRLALYSSQELVWALDYNGKVYSWIPESGQWILSKYAPKLKLISVGKDEVWGVSENNQVFRRIIMRENGGEGERWIQLHGALLSDIAVVSSNEVWGLDTDGQAYVWSSTTKINLVRNAENIAQLNASRSNQSISIKKDRMYNMCWQKIGNSIPLKKISVCSSGAAWGIGDDPSCIYKLSKHRLLVTSISSSRKVWDDRKINGTTYHIGFWRPLPPPGYHILGHIAERSHLENPSTECIVVQEVGHTKGDIRILVHPVAYRRLWSASSRYGDCSVWRPIPPNSDYVAMGDITVPNLKPEQPDLTMVVCVHKTFVKNTKAYQIPTSKEGYLWSSKGAVNKQNYWSVWLIEPTLDSLLCNTFVTGDEDKPPRSHAYCLRLSV